MKPLKYIFELLQSGGIHYDYYASKRAALKKAVGPDFGLCATVIRYGLCKDQVVREVDLWAVRDAQGLVWANPDLGDLVNTLYDYDVVLATPIYPYYEVDYSYHVPQEEKVPL